MPSGGRSTRHLPSFVLAGRRPELDLPLGGPDGRVFAAGSGAAYMVEGRRVRPGTLQDLAATAKLGHQLAAIDLNSDCMEPLDLPEAVRTRRGTHARLTASDKAIEWLSTTAEDVDDAEHINEILFGAAWHERPRALTILNTTAPLQLSEETAGLCSCAGRDWASRRASPRASWAAPPDRRRSPARSWCSTPRCWPRWC